MSAHEDPERAPSTLLTLPYELRQRILHFALARKGTVELQTPLWAERATFTHPLFHTTRALRTEALQAFYETNTFLWIVDSLAGLSARSDPTEYPLNSTFDPQSLDGNDGPYPLIPAVPWRYPHLLKHLRRLQLNIYLPSNLTADVASGRAWLETLPAALQRLVDALDQGRRLEELHVLLTAKRFSGRVALAGEQLKAIDVLARMRVRGVVRVQTRFDFKEVKTSIETLEWEKRMKA